MNDVPRAVAGSESNLIGRPHNGWSSQCAGGGSKAGTVEKRTARKRHGGETTRGRQQFNARQRFPVRSATDCWERFPPIESSRFAPRTGAAVVARASRPCDSKHTGGTPVPPPRLIGSLDLQLWTPIGTMNRAGFPQIQRRPLMVFSAFRRSSPNLRGSRFMKRQFLNPNPEAPEPDRWQKCGSTKWHRLHRSVAQPRVVWYAPHQQTRKHEAAELFHV